MFFGIENHSYKYIKKWLHINKKCNIQAFTFREIKSFSVTLDFLLLIFWPFQDISVCVSAIYCKMGKFDRINTVFSKFSLLVLGIQFYIEKLPFLQKYSSLGNWLKKLAIYSPIFVLFYPQITFIMVTKARHRNLSRLDGLKFHPVKLGSCNHRPSQLLCVYICILS